MDADELVALADALYAGPLTEFTVARDSAAARLKKDDPAAAAEVKRLRKPTLAAWALGQFVRREGGQVEALLELGESLREAQAALDGAELRALTKQRRQVVAAMTQQVRALAHQLRHPVSPTVAEQVETTLTAALLDARAAEALRTGLLISALRATGVEEVDVSAALAVPDALGFSASTVATDPGDAPVPPKLRVVPDPDAVAKQRRAAKQQVTEAERSLAKVLREQRSRDKKFAELEARALQVQARIDEIRRTLADLEDEADQVDAELADAEIARAESAEEVERAEAVRDAARAELDALA